MKASKCKPTQSRARINPAPRPVPVDEFEIALVAELRHLRRREKDLARMFPRLASVPQLRGWFLDQLAEMQERAQRLDAVLSPVGALEFGRTATSAASRTIA